MNTLIGWGTGSPPVVSGGRGTQGVDAAAGAATNATEMGTPGYSRSLGTFQFALTAAATGKTVIVDHVIDRDGALETRPQIVLNSASPSASIALMLEAGVADRYDILTAYDSAKPGVPAGTLTAEVYVEPGYSVGMGWWDNYIPALAIAWGTPYYDGGQPGTSPFLAGASGHIALIPLIYESFAFGLTSGPGYSTVSVDHTYAPSDGAPEYHIDTYYLYTGNTSKSISVGSLQRSGIHTLTASVGYEQLPTKLVLAVTPDSDPMNDYYGAAAWYEEAAEPPVSAFWTRFINSKEVIE